MHVRRQIALSMLGAVVAVSFSAAGSADTTLGCGAVIQQDTILANDIVGCTGNGLVVAGDDVTLDLGGHRVTGTGSAGGISVLGARAVVTNGVVSGFGTGVYFKGDAPTLSHVRVTENVFVGVSIDVNADGFRLLGNSIRHNNGVGVGVSGTSGGLTRGNDIVGNGGDGLRAGSNSDQALYESNTFSGNGGYGLTTQNAVSRVIANVANANGKSGISIFEQFDGFSQGYLIADNSADRNGNYGIEVSRTPSGESPRDGGGNTARHNGNPLECLNIVCNAS